MTKRFEDYYVQKDKIIGFLRNSSKIFEEYPNEKDNVLAIESLIKSIEKNRFEIVFIGEFSAGKSTFLNALMGKRLLPSFANETTATVTYMHDANELDEYKPGIIKYNNGDEKILPDLSLETIEKAVSTKGDINKQDKTVAKLVEWVDLYIKDNQFLKDGVLLVDSPGLNGCAEGHEDITLREIKKAHACIFVFNSDHPGSNTDFKFLQNVKKENSNLFFVLNKIDLINPDEGNTVEDIVNDLKREYKKRFSEETFIPKVFPISSRAALASRDETVGFRSDKDKADTPEKKKEYLELSRISEFEDRLIKFLTKGEKTKVQFLGPITKVESFLIQLKNKLEAENDCLSQQKATNELLERKNKLDEEIKINENEKISKTTDIENDFSLIIDEINEKVSSQCEDINNSILDRINRLENDKLKNYAENLLHSNIQNKYSILASEIKELFNEKVIDLVNSRCKEALKTIQEKINSGSDEVESIVKLNNIELGNLNLISANLESFRKEEKKLDDELIQLEKDSFKIKIDAVERAEKEEKVKNLYKKLERIRNNKADIQRTFIIPDAVERLVEEYEDLGWRERGLIGYCWGALFGGNKVKVNKPKPDDRNRIEAKERLANILKEYGNEESEIQKQIELLNIESGKNAIVLDYEAQQMQRDIDKYTKKAEELRNKFNTEVNEVLRKNKETLTEYIENYINDENKIFKRNIKHFFRNQTNTHLELINSVINKGIDNLLKTKKEELENIILTLEKQGTEREETISKNTNSIKLIKELLAEGCDIEAELETDFCDKIETDSIENINVK